MSVIGSNRVLFMCDGLKVGRVVLCGQSEAGYVSVRGPLKEVLRSSITVPCSLNVQMLARSTPSTRLPVSVIIRNASSNSPYR